MDKDVLEHLLNDGLSLERIAERFEVHPSTVGYWVKKHGLSAAFADRHAARGGIPRPALEGMIAAGGTHRSIAEALEVSVATVKHWLKRYGLETYGTATRRESREGRRAGIRTLSRNCAKHGETTFVLDPEGIYRCRRCRGEAVMKRRRALRARIVSEAGGCCVGCGYNAYLGALQFHHLDPGDKHFALSGRGLTRSLDRLREEAKKCVLLCANCHAEVEGGVRTLSLEFRSR
ncbi:MAG TPA: hypothetical protein VF032_13035 [Thermoleophilaceae bacterium]